MTSLVGQCSFGSADLTRLQGKGEVFLETLSSLAAGSHGYSVKDKIMKVNQLLKLILITLTLTSVGLARRSPHGQACIPPPSDLVAWWTGDGNALDYQGDNNGTAHGGVTFPTGKVGEAFGLNGTDAYVSVPNNDNFNPTGPFSVDVWINANSQQTSAQSLIIDKSHGFTDSTGWAIQTNPDGTAYFFYGTGGSGSNDFHGSSTQASILDGQWHHLAGVWTGTEIMIYEDGVLQNTLVFQYTSR